MQLTPMLIFVTITTVIDAAMIPATTSKMPTERHRPSLFPKTAIKFVVTPMPRQHVTEKTTRKPLMKKLLFPNISDNANNVLIKHSTHKPTYGAGNAPEYMAIGKPVNSPEVVKSFQESKETNIDSPDEEIQTAVYPMNEMENNNVAMSKRRRRPKRLLKLDNDSEEYLDWQEFIFLSPSKQMEKEKTSIEESDEYITTENTLRPGFLRLKRSNNIIEEENLGTTVAGYKFTWHDTRLTNNLVFKNIHS